MAQKCVFCGKEIGLFSRENTVCGGVEQPTCLECYKLVRELSQKERGERALATGRAVDPERIMANLKKAEQKEKDEQERQEKACQALRTGGEMPALRRPHGALRPQAPPPGGGRPVWPGGPGRAVRRLAGGGCAAVRQLRLGGILPPAAPRAHRR